MRQNPYVHFENESVHLADDYYGDTKKDFNSDGLCHSRYMLQVDWYMGWLNQIGILTFGAQIPNQQYASNQDCICHTASRSRFEYLLQPESFCVPNSLAQDSGTGYM
jgi:hypothetical protein